MDNKMTAEQALREYMRGVGYIYGLNWQSGFLAGYTEATHQALSAPRVPDIILKWVASHPPELPDHACAECTPQSDCIKPGFQCGYHVAISMLAASPEPVAPKPEGQITNQGAVYSQAEAWQSVVEALDALQPGWILQVGKTATESAVELIRDWQADAAQYHVVMAEGRSAHPSTAEVQARALEDAAYLFQMCHQPGVASELREMANRRRSEMP